MRMRILAGLGASIAMAAAAQADVKLAAIFGNHMVLQRDARVAVWGWADPTEAVSVRGDWMDADAAVVADEHGHWQVHIKTGPAGGAAGHRLTVKGKNTVELSDVVMGEVWVCSGQSNMEWPLRAADGAAEALGGAGRGDIRLFNVENTVAAAPKEDCRGAWAVSSADSAKDFSAVGYFFARRLADELKVPIGMVEADWGGTPAEAWTSAEGLKGFSEFAAGLEQMRQYAALGPVSVQEMDRRLEAWRSAVGEQDAGIKGGWMKGDGGEGGGQTARVPGAWSGNLEAFDGVVWMRREVEIPASWQGRDLVLEMGPIDDVDDTYFNGELVGKSWDAGAFSRGRKYTVPGKLVKAGKNVLVVRVLDTGGPGGIGGTPEQQKIGPPGEAPMSLAGDWSARVGAELAKLPERPASRGVGPNMPSSLFNGMIAPISGYGIRGSIWYQGEANVGRADEYRRLFPAMIRDWRRVWGAGEFPFYFVQIAPFNYQGDHGQAAELREAQMLSLATPATGMAVTMDIGNAADIHPRDKVDVGNRLALWALAKTYGKSDVECSGPVYRSMVVDGGKVRLTFDHAKGLAAKGGTLKHFQVAGEDGKFVDAEGKVDGESVVVSSPDVAKPAAVRYCWGAGDDGTLVNGDGLPAPWFRTERPEQGGK